LISCNVPFRRYKIFNMDRDIVPADKELRKKFIIFIVSVTILAIVIEPYIKGYLEQIKQLSPKDPELAFKKSMFILKVALGLLSLLLLSMGVCFILLARKTLRSGQYPPPGMKVIRETRLRTGTQARRAGIFLIVLSCILILFGFFFSYWPYAFEKTLLKKKSSNEKIVMTIKKGGEIV
jgi:hypothetical protein